jgi:O-antigen/teichoic acid export membrane protein
MNLNVLSRKHTKNEKNKIPKDNTKDESHFANGKERKKFVKHVGLVGIAEIAVAIGGLIFIPLLTKTLGAYGYGLYQQMLVTIGILSPLASFGLNNALVRFLPAMKAKKDKQNIFFSILSFKLVTSIIIASLLFIFSETISKAFFDGETYIVLLTGIIFLIAGSNILGLFYFRSTRQFKIYVILRVLDSYSKIALAYYMIVTGRGIFGVIFSYFVVTTFFALISLLLVALQIGISLPKFKHMKTWFKYGIPLIPTGLSLWIITFSDRYVISYVLGISFVGIYSAAYMIGFSFYMLIELINFVLVPTASKLYDEGEFSEVQEYLSYVLKFFLLIAIPAVVGLTIFSREILALVTTPAIAEVAWKVLPIIATCTLLAGIGDIFDKTLRLKKKTTKIGIVITAAAIINLLLNFTLIPEFGILGAAIATIIAYGLSASLMIFFSTREFKFKVDTKTIIKIVLASAVMALIGFLWNPVTVISLVLCILACIAAYFLILYLLRVFSLKEVKFLLESVLFKK